MKKISLILITILFKQILFGQGGFSKNYFPPGSFVSVCTDVIEAPNGNIIMTGLTFDSPTGSNRLTIIGADAQGTELWRKNYGNDKFEYLDNNFSPRSLIKGNSNCFYFISCVRDSNNKYFSTFIKFNYNGDTLWQKKYYDPTDYLYVQGVIKSVDNGFLMTGFFEGQTNESCLLLKTDSIGNELWRKKINKPVPDIQAGNNLVQDSLTKKIVIAGNQANGNASGYVISANVIVTDSLGNVLQRKTYSGPCGGIFTDIIQTKDKKFIAVGQDDQCSGLGGPNGTSRDKAHAVKFDLNNILNLSWNKEFDVLSIYNSFSTINELANGDLILGGILDTLSNYFLNDKAMLRLIKLDKDGNVKWNKTFSRDYANENSKSLKSLNVTANGSFLTANALYYAPNLKPYSITKIDSMGCDSTVAYCQTVGFEEFALNNTLFSIYPNPCSSQLNIESGSFLSPDRSEIKIVNILGQKVIECKFENKLNISVLKNGIYFLEIYNKDKLIATQKIVKE